MEANRRKRTARAARRRDIAVKCFGGVRPEVAVARLGRWINADRAMRLELDVAGYRPRSRYLAAREVSILRRYLSW